MRPTRPALRYHGGKYRLADWVISYFPAHRIYTEAYCGAASVLLAKSRAYSEVINDLNEDVVNLFRVLRDPCSAKDLANLLRMTPYARAEFEGASLPSPDPLEAARRLIVRSFMGFGSAASNPLHDTGFRSNSNRSGTTPAHDWMHFPDAILTMTARLQGVVIENRPAVALLQAHDSTETLHYVDPPYVHSTRCFKSRQSGQVYSHEMSDDNHRELAAVLAGCAGMVVLSGYPSGLYDELYAGWHCVQRKATADGARPRTECLWLNHTAAIALRQKSFSFEEIR
ncbi:MAG: DNA adenine methylase [Janthinobacterium lividum]